MSIPQPHVGDVGTAVRVVFYLPSGEVWDISSATLIQITHTAPSGATTVQVAPTVAFQTDGSDGAIQYLTEADFWDEAGDWSAQGYAELADGTKRHTSIEFYSVAANS